MERERKVIAKIEELEQPNAEFEQGRREGTKDRWQAEERRRRPDGRQCKKGPRGESGGKGKATRGGRKGRKRRKKEPRGERRRREGSEAFDHPVPPVDLCRLVSMSPVT